MLPGRTTALATIALGLLAAAATGQNPTYGVALTAETDPAATETGGFLLSIPGVGNDFVLFGDGQFVERPDGTARLSAFVHRQIALDRELFVQLEFAGRLGPSDVGYPPAGSPVVTLHPSAYVPTGSIDPATWAYYTQVTGSMTGLRTYDGARITVANQGAAQLGAGASNKNVQPGLALDLDLTVVQQPVIGSIVPTGPAQLRATLAPSASFCATHVDADPAVSSGPSRIGLEIPGLGSDYVFLPVGTFVEANDGTATINGVMRRQSDHADEWSLSLSLSGRVDPGSPLHPPTGSPVTGLLPAAYDGLGGPVDPEAWRYYTVASGTLTGGGLNAGGSMDLAQLAAVQVGLGAGQGNLFIGVSARLAATNVVQPTAHTIAVTGDVQLHTNVAARCLIPLPQVVTGINQTLPSVTELKATFTGVDLGWTIRAAVGPHQLEANPRKWVEGNIRIVDHDTVEMSIPQGLAPGTYPMRLFTVGGISNALTLQVVAPTSITLRTEDDRAVGEIQHWLIHQGPVASLAFTFLFVSVSNVPSPAPGIVMLDIGDNFTNYVLLGGALHDPATGVASVAIGPLDSSLVGLRIYAQSAVWDTGSVDFFPLLSSDVWFTDYL